MMNVDSSHDFDIAEIIYLKIKQIASYILNILGTLFIRFRKFLALPYCYFKFVDWKVCTASRYQVFKDFLYIFFKLKYYPENYGYCRFWEKERDEWKYYYGSNYDAYQSYKLEKEVQRKEYQILFEDKQVCQQLCDGAGLNMPKCVGVLYPSGDYRSKLASLFRDSDQEQLIIKPVLGQAGQGIFLARKEKDTIRLKTKKNEIGLDDLLLKERCVVQEVIELDERLSIISSAASLRLITFITKSDEIIIFSGELLMSVGDSYLSNWSAGGIQIGVHMETGMLMEIGSDKTGRLYKEHPTSKLIFKEFQIPKWKEILDFAIKVQATFPYYKLLGPDITLSKDGPILYEINATPDLASTEQVVGPLLANKRIRDEFRSYDLFINKYQKRLS
jgi:putative polysaccharide biosynthesis protein